MRSSSGGQNRKGIVIDGLKLTMTGNELKVKLEERIQWHHRNATRNARLLNEPDPNDETPLPEGVLENEIDQSQDQIEVLTLIRDHILAEEVYRLGEHDLRFADLLPEENWFHYDCFGGGGALRRMDLPEVGVQ